ncbi:E3 ubiquitin-protein ligase TRIM71-like isoform X3 [Nylanderia fulva]|nr:E3 ubiquitin-protein ligase TRIM71-like isoform X3 [Nylanderia fulva]
MNQLKSPRNRVDYNRHFMQLTNKPRKQEDQHFTPKRLSNVRKARSFSSPSPERFMRHFSPGKLSQQHPNSNLSSQSIFNQADSSFLYQPRLYNQSMVVGSLGSTGDSRPGSSDDSLANRSSPIRQLDTSSPDDFGYFRMFEDASIPDVSGLSFSSAPNSSENCQADCETFEDLNMNFLKFDLLDINDNYSIRQPSEQLIHNSNVQSDMSSVPLMTLATKELEITQDMGQDSYSEQKSPEQQIHSPNLQRDEPLMPLMPKTFEIVNEMEKDDDAGNIQRDVSSVPLMENELELAKETEIATEIENNQSLDHSSNDTLPYHCGKHPYTQLLYCQTCCKSVCKECAVHCTCKHVTVDLVEFTETAQRQAEDVLMEAYLGIDVLADDMENMGLDIAALDQRTREALSDVKFFSRRMWSAVEEREKKLFKQIVEARRWKFEVLHERYMHLKEDKSRLAHAVSALKYAIYDARFPNLACNPDDLLKRKDMVLAEIWQIRQNRKMKSRSTREENWISFKSSDSNVLAVIANGGNVLLNSPGTIGDRLPSNRDYRLSQYFPYGLNEQMMQPIPRGRPIANYERNIVLPNRKADLQIKSTDVQIIGHFGENNAENLCRPWGLTCDNEGNIIVSDRSNNRIQIYRDDGTLVRKFGSYGNGPCQFNRPAGIAVDARRRLIVVDKDNHRIQILTMEGEFLRSFGEHGEKQGQFCYPWDVAVNTACEIAVTDTRNHRVQLFSAEGIPLRMFGGQQHLLRYLDSPRGICFNQEGKLIVTDFNNHHLLIIEHNMTDMRILKCEKELKGKKQDGSGENDGQNDENAPTFQRPQGVIVADDGSILVADSRHNSIKAFNSVGSLIYSYKPGQDEMDRPLGIALYWDGRMAFTDYGRNYVRLVRLEHHVDPVSRNAIMFG